MIEVLDEWGFVSKLGFFMMDNAPNNDTMMRALQRGIYTSTYLIFTLLIVLELLKSKWRLNYDAKTHRLHYQGHIINLAIQSFLFVTQEENLEKLDSSANKYEISLQEINEWRRRGPLGKLYNLVVHIQRSVQREQLFWELSNDHHLVRDNDTRWNSWFIMI